MVRGLFESAQYNSEAGAKCALYSRARTKQGRGVIKEIRYSLLFANNTYIRDSRLNRPESGYFIICKIFIISTEILLK